jgi:hypothetical protein
VSFQTPHYIDCVSRLTKNEQLVVCVVAGLLLIGWVTKAWRNAHPVRASVEQSGL